MTSQIDPPANLETRPSPASSPTPYRTILRLAIPVGLQGLLMSMLSLTDQLMVGQLGDLAVASAGIAAQLSNIARIVALGLVSGISAFTAQHWARGERSATRSIFGFSMRIVLLIAAPLTALGLLFPELLMRPFTSDAALLEAGEGFTRLIAASFIPGAAVIAASGVLRAMGKMKLPLHASIIAILTNIALDWLLIFGQFGLPELGLLGAGIGTLVARIVELVILLRAVRRSFSAADSTANVSTEALPAQTGDSLAGRPISLSDPTDARTKTTESPTNPSKLEPGLRKKMLLTATPLVLNELLWVLSENSYAAVYGHMGTEALAAMTITYPLQGMVFGLLGGIAATANPLIGAHLGLGDLGKAQADALRLSRLTLGVSAGLAVLIALGAGGYVSLFAVSYDVQFSSIACLLTISALLLVKAQNQTLYDGVIVTGGDTRFMVVAASLATWLVGVPLAFISAFVWNWPLWLVLLALSTEEFVRFGIGLHRVLSKNWMKLTGPPA